MSLLIPLTELFVISDSVALMSLLGAQHFCIVEDN